MEDLSETALVLLTTIKNQGQKYNNIGTYFTDGLVAYWYHSKNRASALDESDKAAIKELLDNDFARPWRGKKDEYELTPKGEAFTAHSQQSSQSTYHQTFSNISGSNIANMSSHTQQALDLSSYSVEIQNEIEALHEAVAAKDDTRVKRIIDGLWVSAPQLVLGLIQIALAANGAGK